MIAAASIAVFDLIERDHPLAERFHENAVYFRREMTARGFDLVPGEHPSIPIMLGDADLANQLAGRLLERAVHVVGFSYPVVLKGQARIRTQISAGLTLENLYTAIEAFTKVGRGLRLVG